MSPSRHLVVFAREPRLGRVKTRLARDIGAVAALRFYRRTLARLLRILSLDGRWRCWLAVTPDRAAGGARPWPPGWQVIGQGGGDLGRRMARVARALPPGPVVIVGADVPGLGPRHVAGAFRALRRADACFGPAPDGGYWLVGLRRGPGFPDVFRGVRWSGAHALQDTIANLGPGRRHALLETLADVDDGEAYARWRRGE